MVSSSVNSSTVTGAPITSPPMRAIGAPQASRSRNFFLQQLLSGTNDVRLLRIAGRRDMLCP